MARRKRKYKNIIILLTIAVLIALSVHFKIFEKEIPLIFIEDTPYAQAKEQDKIYTNFNNTIFVRILDEFSGIKNVKIMLQKKDEKDIVLYDEKMNKQKEVLLQFKLPQSIKDNATLRIEAKDGSFWNFFSGNIGVKEVAVIIDTQKPAINILSNSYQIEQGGAAAVVFETRDENLQELYIEDNFGRVFNVLPFFKENYYGAIIAWNARQREFSAFVVAKDKAGNENKTRIRYFIKNRSYRNSNITLKDNFLDGKIADLAAQYASEQNLTRLDKFKFVNETLRSQNEALINKYTQNIGIKPLDEFSTFKFIPLKGAVKVADFADHRFYHFNNSFISESYHMGIDLASVARADIFSSLNGKVVFADENGIYGINLIIDHGFGLYSLYGHCSFKFVADGDEVKSGDIIAKTGVSGLALGDHLHFEIRVQGLPVRPEQFQDEQWIKNNISAVFEEGRKIILRQRQ